MGERGVCCSVIRVICVIRVMDVIWGLTSFLVTMERRVDERKEEVRGHCVELVHSCNTGKEDQESCC